MRACFIVRQPGFFTTVQDLGRHGFQHLGVPVSGALDTTSLRLANLLVSNREDTAGLEFCYAGPVLEVAGGPVRVALGGPVAARIEGREPRPLPPWRSTLLEAGDVLTIGPVIGAMCGYLAVEGGIDVPVVLGSRSTYTRAELGGFNGRALAAGDKVPLAPPQARLGAETCLAAAPLAAGGPFRVVLGPDAHHFHEEAIATLQSSEYVVSREADRIGLRLEGPALRHSGPAEILSQGTANGTIQVPGSGQPIILLADRQTTGGYTKIATVISCDLPRVGRLAPGARLTFEAFEHTAAIELARAEAAAFQAIIRTITTVGVNLADAAELLACNLVDGFVSALDEL